MLTIIATSVCSLFLATLVIDIYLRVTDPDYPSCK